MYFQIPPKEQIPRSPNFYWPWWKTGEVEEDLVTFPVFKSLSKRDCDAIAGGFVFFDARQKIWPENGTKRLRWGKWGKTWPLHTVSKLR